MWYFSIKKEKKPTPWKQIHYGNALCQYIITPRETLVHIIEYYTIKGKSGKRQSCMLYRINGNALIKRIELQQFSICVLNSCEVQCTRNMCQVSVNWQRHAGLKFVILNCLSYFCVYNKANINQGSHSEASSSQYKIKSKVSKRYTNLLYICLFAEQNSVENS